MYFSDITKFVNYFRPVLTASGLITTARYVVNFEVWNLDLSLSIVWAVVD